MKFGTQVRESSNHSPVTGHQGQPLIPATAQLWQTQTRSSSIPNGFDGSENSEAFWILPPFCFPPLNEEILFLMTITVTLTIYVFDTKSQMVWAKKWLHAVESHICVFLLALSEDLCANMDESPKMQFSEVTCTAWCLPLIRNSGEWKWYFESLTWQELQTLGLPGPRLTANQALTTDVC